MVNPDKLFSREALDKMRSPEKLDTLLHITNPIGWMGLIAVLLLLLGVVLWSFMGAFTVKADGFGLIMDAGGVKRFVANGNGIIDEFTLDKGERVKAGQIVGHIEQVGSAAQVDALLNGVELGSNRIDVQQRVNQYDSRHQSDMLMATLVSPYSGIVDSISVDVGAFVTAGTEICTIRMDEGRSDLIGVMYVPVDKGKRIEQGMSIQLAPNGTDISQSGSLLGVVRAVSQYPANQSEMIHRLGNAQMVTSILQACQGSAVEVTFDLVRDPKDASGYLWTAVVGDQHRPVTPGTYITGSVIIERKPPIEKVFYKVSQWLRNR